MSELKKANFQYALLHSFFWSFACICYAYLTYYLTVNGFTTGEVGVLLAVFGILSVGAQLVAGKAADTIPFLNWRILLLAISAGTVLIGAGLFLVSEKKWIGLLFGLLFLSMNTMRPMMNAACFDYIDRGVRVNFGIARGVGSLIFAGTSYLLGLFTVRMGALPVRIVAVTMPFAIFLLTLTMKASAKKKTPSLKRERTTSPLVFMKENRAFIWMVVGVALFMTFHNFLNDYLLQIVQNVGGNSADMGFAVALAAIIETPFLFLFVFIVKKISPGRLLAVASVGYIIRLVALIMATDVRGVLLTQFFQMITYSFYASASVYFVNEMIPVKDRVTGHALMTNTDTVGSLLGGFIGGLLIQFLGVSATLKAFLLVVTASAAAVFYSLFLRSRRKGVSG